MIKIFVWDYKEQPDLLAICEAVEDAISQIAPDLGGVHYDFVDTEADEYMFWVSDNWYTDEQIQEIYDKQFIN